MKLRHTVTRLASAMAVSALMASAVPAAPAHADVYPIEYSVTATAKLSAQTIKVKKKVNGTAKVVFVRHFLGIPMPSTGFYSNSFPVSVKKPTLTATNVALNSRKYAQKYNTWLKKSQWEVNGKQDFAGRLTASITGSAVGATKGAGYFYGGTYTCGDNCINAHAIKKLTVKK